MNSNQVESRIAERVTPPALLVAVVAAAYLAFSVNLPSLASIRPSGVAIAPPAATPVPRL
ncbi:MAG: hypothetical protein SFV21_01885 [Rhodospirillaceae bacterium]|nr:hypothetical protein [Rhodospirillaceae bacterium]